MSEKELVKLLKAGDRNAFNELVAEYQSKVINIAYGMLSNEEDALDAAQDVFIKVFKSIDTFRGDSALSTWIFRITANICKDYLRKRMRTVSTVSIDATDDDDNEIFSIHYSGDSPEQATIKGEMHENIRQAINSLNEESRAVLVLFDIEGFSYDKISEILKIPTGTVKSRLSRARIALRKKISENTEQF